MENTATISGEQYIEYWKLKNDFEKEVDSLEKEKQEFKDELEIEKKNYLASLEKEFQYQIDRRVGYKIEEMKAANRLSPREFVLLSDLEIESRNLKRKIKCLEGKISRIPNWIKRLYL